MNASTASLPRGAHLEHTDLRAISFHHVRFVGLELVDVEMTGEIEGVTINGVDIGPLVEAELDRRMPARTKMHPTTVEAFQEAWVTLERLWSETEDRARALPPELLHERVRDEWSFIETLRHLGFASAAWVGRMVLGDAVPWHPFDLPWDEAPGWDGVPWDREARPSLEEVLAVRHQRQAMVGDVITALTPDQLEETVTQTEPGWPQLEDFPVAQCLSIVVNEEWHHRLYAERDLDALTASTKTRD
ncbi:DinB family protein [Leekyejoonella antrihumi]|uniref:DinB family protein n=1 Tax=Leekyejoonella antrihumi TaxID=1660198 RepID=A0A563DZ35_9MICO|nr:DinB family protein [Leekyejoonella antrihumi]TWP35261.1 DinB family protein [Leekyejoonella antrihumi]